MSEREEENESATSVIKGIDTLRDGVPLCVISGGEN